MSVRTCVVNLNPSDGVPAVRLNQYDVGVTLLFTVMDGASSADFDSGTTVTIQGTRPSGTGYSLPATLDGNFVTVDSTIEMTREYGDTICELRFVKNGVDVGTGNFKIGVEKAAFANDTIDENVNHWNQLAQQVHADTVTATNAALAAGGSEADAQRAATSAADSASRAFVYAKTAQDAKTDIFEYIDDSEAWAVGTRGGEPVTSSDETYENNSKFYAQSASTSAQQAAVSVADAVKFTPQTLTDAQKAQTRMNIGAASPSDIPSGTVRYDTAQSLTDAQKTQAKTNIGVPAIDATLAVTGAAADAKKVGDEISDIKDDLNKNCVSRFYGKELSIIGDSVDTFDKTGYKVDGYVMHYPTGSITDVEQTWWKKVINASGMTLIVNASYAGSFVTKQQVNVPSFYERISIIGSPDIVFVTLGTNDSYNNISLGEYDFETAYTSLSESTFRTAYIKGVKGLKNSYPSAEIVCISEKMQDAYKESIAHIADVLGVEYIDASDYVVETGYSHPGELGMRQIASLVLYPTDCFFTQEHIPADAKIVGNKLNETIKCVPQTLTEAQKTQARENIGVEPGEGGSTNLTSINLLDGSESLVSVNTTGDKRYGYKFDGLSGDYYLSFLGIKSGFNSALCYKIIHNGTYGAYNQVTEPFKPSLITVESGDSLIIYNGDSNIPHFYTIVGAQLSTESSVVGLPYIKKSIEESLYTNTAYKNLIPYCLEWRVSIGSNTYRRGVALFGLSGDYVLSYKLRGGKDRAYNKICYKKVSSSGSYGSEVETISGTVINVTSGETLLVYSSSTIHPMYLTYEQIQLEKGTIRTEFEANYGIEEYARYLTYNFSGIRTSKSLTKNVLDLSDSRTRGGSSKPTVKVSGLNGKYTFSCDVVNGWSIVDGSNSGITYIELYYDIKRPDGTWKGAIRLYNNTVINIGQGEELYLYEKYGTYHVANALYRAMLESGETASTYEPFVPVYKPKATNVQELIDSLGFASYGDTVEVASGLYVVDAPIIIPFGVSVSMDQYTKIVASNSFSGDYVLKYAGVGDFAYNTTNPLTGGEDDLMGIKFSGGTIDANGLAGCFIAGNGMHLTFENMTFLNPKTSGLNLGGNGFSYENIVKNCYVRTFVAGCTGNIGFNINCMDSHFEDCITQDVSTAFKDNQGANRFLRCHIWGGRLGYPNSHPMLDNSIGFDISTANTLIDCYADSSATGMKFNGEKNVVIGCNWFNNYNKYGLDNVTFIELKSNGTKFIGCHMRTGNTPNYTLIKNTGGYEYEAVACIGFPEVQSGS